MANNKDKQQAIASAINGDTSKLKKMIKDNQTLVMVGLRNKDLITFCWGYGNNRQEVTMSYAGFRKSNQFPGVPLIIVEHEPEYETEN